MQRKVEVDDLELGMYVARLDRPWTESPFMFQGFVIQTAEELEKLRDLGILYAPDFVINAGGLMNVEDELRGYDRERAMQRVETPGDSARGSVKSRLCRSSQSE
jgi:hypothetical protein